MSIAVADILTESRTRSNVAVSSKKKLLELLAEIVSADLVHCTADSIFDSLLAREKLGSTGIGEGIAIPHCRLSQCQQAVGVMLKLSESIDFDSIDHQPVDLVFALLVPEEATDEHLQILATLARNFNEAGYRNQLRSAASSEELFDLAIKAA
ncbi:MAG: PTS IIA-like nitrogen regulatory protein PtsN [Oceanobacter sp.]